jgi:eukaryotic-like serine/threonine-protein kinase
VADPIALLKTAVADRYAIERELGRGGMATVYLARDLKHPRQVAIKVLRSEVVGALGADRFLREIEVVSRLQHPHILGLFDSGTAGDFLYYVMPYVDGESLRQRLIRESQLPVDNAVIIAREVADALNYAHRRGVVHRDIKPENILLSAGQALVADFGIAKALDAAGGEKLTETGLSLGTPHYMSPEQASATRSLDGRSDIYALGCVLYEMLAGQPPFTGPSAQSILARHSVDPVPSLRTVRRTVPAGIEWAIGKAMAKVPADRFASAGEFADALAHPEHAPVQKARGRRWLYAGLAVAVLALVFGLGGRRILDGVSSSAPLVRSLAVLPLENAGDSSLGEAMTEALISDLGRINAWRVTARKATLQYKASPLPATQIARALGVDAVLQGGIRRSGDRLRVDLRLVSAASGRRLWAQRFDQPLANRSSLGPAVSQSLVSALELPISSSEEARPSAAPTGNAEAYDAFLRGKIHVRKENRAEDSIAIGYFEQAVSLDPNFAAAHAELAHAYGLWGFYFAPEQKETLEKGLVAVAKALRLDPDLAEAHFARGYLLWNPASHFAHEQAIQEYKRALELTPNLDDVHHQLALVYLHIGLFEKALVEFRKTVAIDPSNRQAQERIGVVQVYQGLYADGIQTLRNAPREFNPSLWAYHTAWALLYLGRVDEARSIIDNYLKATPKDPGGVVTSVRAILNAQVGERIAAEKDIARAVSLGEGFGHFHHAAYNIASAYAVLGEADLAVQWLRRAAEDGLPCYPLFEKDPNLNNLRQDPGYLALMTELRPQWERWNRTL